MLNPFTRFLFAAASFGLAATLSAQTNLIVNPSFEYYSASAPVITTLYTTATFDTYGFSSAAVGNAVPYGWENFSVTAQDIIYSGYGAGAFPAASAGLVAGGTSGNSQMTQNTTHANSYYLYLGDSAQASTIRQTGILLTAGTTYTLTFQLAPAIYVGAPDAKVDVQLVSLSQTLSPATFVATAGGGWQTQTYTFTAGFSQSYTLYFASTAGFNTLVDNVSLTAVPEPSTYAALFGAGALGVTLWRRRRWSTTY